MTGGSQVVVRTPGGGTAIPIVIEPGAQVVLRTPGPQGDVGPASEGPVGGTTGQALVKTSNADHATGWAAPAPAAHAASHGSAGSDPVTLAQSQVTNLATDLAAKVPKSLYDAHTVLASVTDDTPAALTVAEQTLLGRITGGNIAALTVAQIKTLLALAAADVGADPAGSAAAILTAASYPVRAMVAGNYYAPQGVGAKTAGIEGYEYAVPFVPARSCTIIRLGAAVETTAGSAGALLRFGLRAGSFTTGKPAATVLADGGTADATTTGWKEVVVSQAVTAGLLYFITVTHQGAASTRPTLVTVTDRSSLGLGDPYPSLEGPISMWRNNGGITGALSTTETGWVMGSSNTFRLAVRAS